MREDRGQDRDFVVTALSDAFATDPAMTWLKPKPASRARMLPRFFDHARREDLRAGRVMVSPGGETATLWRAPGRHKEEPLGSLRTLFAFASILGMSSGRGKRIAETMARHHPREPHWYLRFIGVRASEQGKGWGGVALREGLSRADADNLPTYLETATPANVGLYQRFGFAIIDEWDIAGGGPHFWGMMRPAV